jgi:hypothetical protein
LLKNNHELQTTPMYSADGIRIYSEDEVQQKLLEAMKKEGALFVNDLIIDVSDQELQQNSNKRLFQI